ncbi:Uncharacterised protein [Klebsiella variicola]|uniref:Uncharacterized protein n=2 Tax=Klebsiella/Raoultella group TaxID=2890311 RepID=A0A7H4N3Y7_KLEVA|nr:Uncharacterised protein [Klebsiella variicola]
MEKGEVIHDATPDELRHGSQPERLQRFIGRAG